MSADRFGERGAPVYEELSREGFVGIDQLTLRVTPESVDLAAVFTNQARVPHEWRGHLGGDTRIVGVTGGSLVRLGNMRKYLLREPTPACTGNPVDPRAQDVEVDRNSTEKAACDALLGPSWRLGFRARKHTDRPKRGAEGLLTRMVHQRYPKRCLDARNRLGRVGRRTRRAFTGLVVQDFRLTPSFGLGLSVIPDGLRSGLQQMNLAVGIHGPLDVHGVPGVLLNL
jgi:hypothetical protein